MVKALLLPEELAGQNTKVNSRTLQQSAESKLKLDVSLARLHTSKENYVDPAFYKTSQIWK
jgi:hypothetical protein